MYDGWDIIHCIYAFKNPLPNLIICLGQADITEAVYDGWGTINYCAQIHSIAQSVPRRAFIP